jgi:hypothetical protein
LNRRYLIAAVAVVMVLTAFAGGAFYLVWGRLPFIAGVRVDVRNVDPGQPLQSVTVVVTGASFRLGDIAPGETKSVRVNPTGESSVVIRHTPIGRPAVDLTVGCYIERNYSGSIQVDVTPTAVARVSDQIRI